MHRTPKQGRKLKVSGKHDVNTRKKSEVASTPKAPYNAESPPWLGESPSCDSAPSPIPFLCTQDGSNGESDVIWNYYSPSSEKEDTPIRKRKKKFTSGDFSPVTRLPMKKKLMRPALRKKEFLNELKNELLTLNKNLQGMISSDPGSNVAPSTSNEESPIKSFPSNFENINFYDVMESAPPPVPIAFPLKKNILDKISKCENDGALESDDSMNEFLLKASQLVEEEHFEKKEAVVCDNFVNNKQPSGRLKNDPIDKVASPKINNDSFENLICNLNDSEIDMLTQAQPKNSLKKGTETVTKTSNNSNNINLNKQKLEDNKNNCLNDDGDSFLNNLSNISNLMNSSILNESRSKFGRYNSMPESPTAAQARRTRGMALNSSFSRHNTMPSVGDNCESDGLSQVIKCTPEEIKKKHQAAREKLMAKKQEPIFKKNIPRTLSSNSLLHNLPQKNIPPSTVNGLKTNHSIVNIQIRNDSNDFKENARNNGKYKFCNMNNNKITSLSKNVENKTVFNKVNLQEEIERKRKEALQKLQMKKALNLQRK